MDDKRFENKTTKIIIRLIVILIIILMICVISICIYLAKKSNLSEIVDSNETTGAIQTNKSNIIEN